MPPSNQIFIEKLTAIAGKNALNANDKQIAMLSRCCVYLMSQINILALEAKENPADFDPLAQAESVTYHAISFLRACEPEEPTSADT